MTPRPWWMGRPLVWAWMVGLALTTCGGMTPCPAQVAPLSVTLSAEAPCPAPAAVTPLLQLPTGCPAPWVGWLYTPAEHRRMRAAFTRLDAAAVAERERVAQRDRALLACRAQRDELGAACVVGVARVEGAVEALSDLSAPAEPRPSLWPWAALSGGLAAVGAGAGAIADRGPGEAIGYSIAGAAVGTVIALMVERWGR